MGSSRPAHEQEGGVFRVDYRHRRAQHLLLIFPSARSKAITRRLRTNMSYARRPGTQTTAVPARSGGRRQRIAGRRSSARLTPARGRASPPFSASGHTNPLILRGPAKAGPRRMVQSAAGGGRFSTRTPRRLAAGRVRQRSRYNLRARLRGRPGRHRCPAPIRPRMFGGAKDDCAWC